MTREMRRGLCRYGWDPVGLVVIHQMRCRWRKLK